MSTLKPQKTLFDDLGAAWQPYRPGPKAPWDAARVAHLHRRAGLGATFGQIRRDVQEGYEPSIHRILNGDDRGPGGQPTAEFDEIALAMEESARRRPSMERVQLLWLYRLIFTPHPLREVTTLAWHGHYATSQAKVNAPDRMLTQNRSQRALWHAPISQLHRRMLNDGAMRRWLDGLNSTKAQPNENLSREFLELFALGLGHYSERDVREVARTLTGWRPADDPNRDDSFDPGDFDAGTKTILGEAGSWGLNDLVRIVCKQAAAATHIARRLYRTFLSDIDEPSPDLMAPLANAMRTKGDVNVARGIEWILRSRLFHSEECRGRQVKSPVAFAIGTVRALELFNPPPDLVNLEIHLTRMGQRLFFPPNVAGWPSGLAWLDSQAVVARANFTAWLTEPSTQGGKDQIGDLADRYGLKSPRDWLDAMANLLLAAPLSPRSRVLCEQRSPDRCHMTRQLLSLPEAQVG